MVMVLTFAGKSRRVPMRKLRKSPSVSSCQGFRDLFRDLFRHILFLPKVIFDIYSGTVDDFRVQTDLPGEGQAVHDKGGCEPVEVPEKKFQQTRRILRSRSRRRILKAIGCKRTSR